MMMFDNFILVFPYLFLGRLSARGPWNCPNLCPLYCAPDNTMSWIALKLKLRLHLVKHKVLFRVSLKCGFYIN